MGSHMAVKRTRVERKKADWSAAARARARLGRHDMCSLRRRRSARGAPWRKAPERTRSIPRAKAAQCARVAIAPTHVEHEERRSTKSEEDDSRGALFLATCQTAASFM